MDFACWSCGARFATDAGLNAMGTCGKCEVRGRDDAEHAETIRRMYKIAEADLFLAVRSGGKVARRHAEQQVAALNRCLDLLAGKK